MDKDNFLKLLFQREQRATQERFKIDFPEHQVSQMLTECYKSVVRRRGQNPIIDTNTQGVIQRISRWLTKNDKKIGLLLYGSVGNGKTTMAKAICELIGVLYGTSNSSTNIAVKQTSALDLANLCTSQTNLLKADDAEERFDRLKNAQMLYIDDLGTEPATVRSWGNSIQPLVDIIYHRYDNQLFTILTTNQDDAMLLKTYDIRVADRIREMFDKLPFTHQSYR